MPRRRGGGGGERLIKDLKRKANSLSRGTRQAEEEVEDKNSLIIDLSRPLMAEQ